MSICEHYLLWPCQLQRPLVLSLERVLCKHAISNGMSSFPGSPLRSTWLQRPDERGAGVPGNLRASSPESGSSCCIRSVALYWLGDMAFLVWLLAWIVPGKKRTPSLASSQQSGYWVVGVFAGPSVSSVLGAALNYLRIIVGYVCVSDVGVLL